VISVPESNKHFAFLYQVLPVNLLEKLYDVQLKKLYVLVDFC